MFRLLSNPAVMRIYHKLSDSKISTRWHRTPTKWMKLVRCVAHIQFADLHSTFLTFATISTVPRSALDMRWKPYGHIIFDCALAVYERSLKRKAVLQYSLPKYQQTTSSYFKSSDVSNIQSKLIKYFLLFHHFSNFFTRNFCRSYETKVSSVFK